MLVHPDDGSIDDHVLKICCRQRRASSSLAGGTNKFNELARFSISLIRSILSLGLFILKKRLIHHFAATKLFTLMLQVEAGEKLELEWVWTGSK